MSTPCPAEREKERDECWGDGHTGDDAQFMGSNLVFGLLEELYSLSNKATYAKFARVSTPEVQSVGERTSGQEPHDQERAEKEKDNFSSNNIAMCLCLQSVWDISLNYKYFTDKTSIAAFLCIYKQICTASSCFFVWFLLFQIIVQKLPFWKNVQLSK